MSRYRELFSKNKQDKQTQDLPPRSLKAEALQAAVRDLLNTMDKGDQAQLPILPFLMPWIKKITNDQIADVVISFFHKFIAKYEEKYRELTAANIEPHLRSEIGGKKDE